MGEEDPAKSAEIDQLMDLAQVMVLGNDREEDLTIQVREGGAVR
jgi:hypothetical protein